MKELVYLVQPLMISHNFVYADDDNVSKVTITKEM